MSELIFALLIALSSPLPLLIVERFLPYPAIIEEVVKLIFVSLIISSSRKKLQYPYAFVVLAGLLFTFSESMFYLMNYFATSQVERFLTRMSLTGTMHVATCVVLYTFGLRGKFATVIGLMCAIAIHALFNSVLITLT